MVAVVPQPSDSKALQNQLSDALAELARASATCEAQRERLEAQEKR